MARARFSTIGRRLFFIDTPSAFLAKPVLKEISKSLDMNSGESRLRGCGLAGASGRIQGRQNKKDNERKLNHEKSK
jgi:hypothetical protein